MFGKKKNKEPEIDTVKKKITVTEEAEYDVSHDLLKVLFGIPDDEYIHSVYYYGDSHSVGAKKFLRVSTTKNKKDNRTYY